MRHLFRPVGLFLATVAFSRTCWPTFVEAGCAPSRMTPERRCKPNTGHTRIHLRRGSHHRRNGRPSPDWADSYQLGNLSLTGPQPPPILFMFVPSPLYLVHAFRTRAVRGPPLFGVWELSPRPTVYQTAALTTEPLTRFVLSASLIQTPIGTLSTRCNRMENVRLPKARGIRFAH